MVAGLEAVHFTYLPDAPHLTESTLPAGAGTVVGGVVVTGGATVVGGTVVVGGSVVGGTVVVGGSVVGGTVVVGATVVVVGAVTEKLVVAVVTFHKKSFIVAVTEQVPAASKRTLPAWMSHTVGEFVESVGYAPVRAVIGITIGSSPSVGAVTVPNAMFASIT